MRENFNPEQNKKEKEEEVKKEINNFLDFLKKIIIEIEKQNFSGKELANFEQVFTLEKIKQLREYLNKIIDLSELFDEDKIIMQILLPLEHNLFPVEYGLEKGIYKNLGKDEKVNYMSNIIYSIRGLIASRKYFSK